MELEHEMGNTRKVLERVPDGKLDYRPHPKSMSIRGLATHLANMPHWATAIIGQDSLDVAPADTPLRRAQPVASRQEALTIFDKNVAEGRAAIGGASDERLLQPWSLLNAGKAVFTLPRLAVLRAMIVNHTIHHRAQLIVYLRLNDVPVPGMYGPSADEA